MYVLIMYSTYMYLHVYFFVFEHAILPFTSVMFASAL